MRTILPSSRTHAATAAVVALGFLAAVVRLCVEGSVQGGIALAFGAVIALGEAMRITLPGGRDNAPLSATACLGYALTYRIGGQSALWTGSQVVVVVTVAVVVGSVPQFLAGRPPSAGYLVRRVGVTGFVAWIARTVLHAELSHASRDEFLLIFSALACMGLLLDSGWAAVFATTTASPGLSGAYQVPMFATTTASLGRSAAYQGPTVMSSGADPFGAGAAGAAGAVEAASASASALDRREPPAYADTAPKGEVLGVPRRLSRFLMLWVRECTATARVCPAVAALSVALALAAEPLGLWVLPIAAAPILVMQRALRRYAAIRATYQQTIRALSRITDLAGYTEPGHARRVCRLALAIGRELGMSEPELLDLEYAALLHDLGQLSLADPLPGGATVTAAPEVVAEVAARGAEVVRQTGVLDRVARLVQAQCTPYAQAAGSAAERPGPVSGGGVSGGAASDGAASGGGVSDGAASAGASYGTASGGAVSGAVGVEDDEVRAAAVLRVANDFEDLCNAEPGPAAHTSALARIRLGDGRIYDPQAVAALARLVLSG